MLTSAPPRVENRPLRTQLHLIAIAVASATLLALGLGRAQAAPTSWTRLNLTGGDVGALAVDPSNPSIVYAGTYKGGVFKSTDGGQTWSPRNTGFTPGSYLKI